MERLAIGIDIGGQSSKCGVVTQDGTILEQSVVTSLIDNFDEYLELLAGTVKELMPPISGGRVTQKASHVSYLLQNALSRLQACMYE